MDVVLKQYKMRYLKQYKIHVGKNQYSFKLTAEVFDIPTNAVWNSSLIQKFEQKL